MISPQSIDLSRLPSAPLSGKSSLPNISAVYFVMDGNEVLYVGQTRSLYARWVGHHRYQAIKKLHPSAQLVWLEVNDESLLMGIESALIKHFCPGFNGSQKPRRKRQNPIISRTARLSKDIAEMLDLYAEEQQWSANTAMDNILRRYLEGLGYAEKVAAKKQAEQSGAENKEDGDTND